MINVLSNLLALRSHLLALTFSRVAVRPEVAPYHAAPRSSLFPPRSSLPALRSHLLALTSSLLAFAAAAATPNASLGTFIVSGAVKDGDNKVLAGDSGTLVRAVDVNGRAVAEAEVGAALSRKVEATPEDGIEARQMKAMVEGMKDELRRYLAKGGKIASYGRRVVRRQEEEIAYYNRAKTEIENAKKSKMPAAQLNDLWEKRNESLRQMGVKLVPMPE